MLIALCPGNGGQALLRDAHKVVLGGGRANGVNGDAQVTVRPVLEAHREGQAGRELTVKLALRGAGTNGTDRDEVGKELGGNGVEHLRGNGHARRGQVAEELPRDAETLVDLEGLVDIGVVDQTLPADRRPRLLEVGAHHNDEVLRELVRERLQPVRVLDGRGRVVDRTGTNNDQEAVVAAHDDIRGIASPLDDSLEGLIGHGDFRDEEGRRNEGVLAQHFCAHTESAMVTAFARHGFGHWGAGWPSTSCGREEQPSWRQLHQGGAQHRKHRTSHVIGLEGRHVDSGHSSTSRGSRTKGGWRRGVGTRGRSEFKDPRGSSQEEGGRICEEGSSEGETRSQVVGQRTGSVCAG